MHKRDNRKKKELAKRCFVLILTRLAKEKGQCQGQKNDGENKRAEDPKLFPRSFEPRSDLRLKTQNPPRPRLIPSQTASSGRDQQVDTRSTMSNPPVSWTVVNGEAGFCSLPVGCAELRSPA